MWPDREEKNMKKIINVILNYFFRGLLFVFPVAATVWLIYAAFDFLSSLISDTFSRWFGISAPILSLIILFFLIVFVGYIISNTIAKPFLRVFDSLIVKIPLIGLVYTSLKDLTEAFVGEKRKFTKPVIIEMTGSGMYKLGFITQEDLAQLNLKELVAVYCPHSYNFSGNLFLAPPEKIKPIDGNAAEIMKFIVSAGVTNINTSPGAGKKSAKELSGESKLKG